MRQTLLACALGAVVGCGGSVVVESGASGPTPVGSWKHIPPPQVAGGFPACAWTGSAFVVWGGAWVPDILRDGAVFDPATDLWRVMSGVGAPTARIVPSAGSAAGRLVVHGGIHESDAEAPLQDGGVYDPSLDAWTGLNLDGAPYEWPQATLSLSSPVALYEWGGVEPPPAGGIYSPASDTWSTMAPPILQDGVAGRWGAVWTGSRVIEWGASEHDQVVMQGGATYDPAFDDWTAISVMGAPSSRSDFSAVWTGSAMIVWGGRVDACQKQDDGLSACELADGAAYDPASDSWTPIANDGAPTPRRLHQAFWTGNEMLVLGRGWHDEAEPRMTGGLYDPVLDAWTPTTTAGAPPTTFTPVCGAWDGHRAILWGGDGSLDVRDAWVFEPHP